MEGEENGEWIIVDCGAAVAHIMQPSIREYYHLEEIWGAKPVSLKRAAQAPGLVKAAQPQAPAPRKAAPRTAATRTAPARKAPAKKAPTKKTVAGTAAVKKPAVKKPAAKKPAAKKAPARKVARSARG
jgi:ribosome-associated protein